MSACILALELLTIFIYHIVVGPLVHQVYGFIAYNILICAVLYVYLCEIFAVVALSLGQHPTLLIILKLLRKVLRIFIELYVRALVFVPFSEESNTVALAYYPAYSPIVIIFLLVLVLIHEHIILILGILKVVLLLF